METPHSILVVDDDDALRRSTVEYLERLGYTTISATSAEDALDMMKLFQADIVLTDISMKGMNGLELTRSITANYNSEVIVMTGYIAEHSYEEAVGAGASDFIFKPFRFEELNLRIRRVIREITLKKRHAEMVKELEALAVTDGLTGLYNQRHFYQQLKKEIERHLRYNAPLSLMLFDIDNFKQFNDTYGHLEGDNVLVTLSQITQNCLRSMDSAYRYGGEEFTVILPETDLEHSTIVGERIRNLFSEYAFTPALADQNPHGDELMHPNATAEKADPKSNTTMTAGIVHATISIGVTQYSPLDTINRFIKRADRAMYLSKKGGRNRLTALPAKH